jgi:Trk-type K+ transport system membrane component
LREDRRELTETPIIFPLELEDLEEKLRSGRNLTPEELNSLVTAVREIRENDIPHLKIRIERLESASKRSAKSVLLGLTCMLWVATPIAFLSIPLIGILFAVTATFSTVGYLRC